MNTQEPAKEAQPLDGLAPEQVNIAIKDPEHLKRWLVANDLKYLAFDATQMVDALPFPEGTQALQQILDCYAQHRMTFDTEWVQHSKNAHGDLVEAPVMQYQNLEATEVEACIEQLRRNLEAETEKRLKNGARKAVES